MENNTKTIGEWVAEDYRKAEVFRKYGIDFCCGGKKSVNEACQNKGVDYSEVMAEIQKVDSQQDGPINSFEKWSTEFLAQYITNNHHSYVRESLPMLLELSQKVARVHGETHPELIEVAHIVIEMANELTSHMKDEEEILFPFIYSQAKEDKIKDIPTHPIIRVIDGMEEEHEAAGKNLYLLRELTSNFTPPAEACTSYRVLFSKLEEFEKDLHQHVHLENNILFPKVKNQSNDR